MNENKIDIAAWMVPLEDGLTKQMVTRLLDLLPDEGEFVPFEAHENNTSCFGFIKLDSDNDEAAVKEIIDFVSPILNDWDLESKDGRYTLPDGRKLYMSSDFNSIEEVK